MEKWKWIVGGLLTDDVYDIYTCGFDDVSCGNGYAMLIEWHDLVVRRFKPLDALIYELISLYGRCMEPAFP